MHAAADGSFAVADQLAAAAVASSSLGSTATGSGGSGARLRPAQRSPGNGIDHGPSGICPHLCWFTDEENVNLCVAQGAAPPPHGGDAPAFPTSYPLTDEY